MTIPCPACGRVVGAYVPAHGDGSYWMPRPHNRPSGGPCPRIPDGPCQCGGRAFCDYCSLWRTA